MRRSFPVSSALGYVGALGLCLVGPAVSPALGQSDDGAQAIVAGSQLDMPEFADYEAHYESAFSTTGAITMQLRRFANGTKLNMIDIIPTEQSVIVATRNINLASNVIEFEVGPYFAWGQEYVVRMSNGAGYSMTRIPFDGSAPIHSQGQLEHGGMMFDMYAPTLAAMLPADVGTSFQLPLGSPTRENNLIADPTTYDVVRTERLELDSGISCDCTVIRKNNPGGSTDLFWVSRTAPFIYRWHRDIGGPREFVSELQAFRTLDR